MLIIAASTLAGAALGIGGATLQRRRSRALQEAAERQRQGARLAAISDRRADLLASARRDADALRTDLATELSEAEAMLAGDETRLAARVEAADRRLQRLQGHQADLDGRFEALGDRRNGINAQRDAIRDAEKTVQQAVEHSAGMTREAIIEELREGYSDEAAMAATKAARLLEEDATERRELFATRIMEVACQRYGAPLPADRLISQVVLPKAAKVKERLLADDRAMLRLITELTEVEFEPQDEEGFHLRAADPYTREIGRLAYERLVRAGNVT
ncbi:MAG: Rnase Y domain-containing protein, partial [bacterium]